MRDRSRPNAGGTPQRRRVPLLTFRGLDLLIFVISISGLVALDILVPLYGANSRDGVARDPRKLGMPP